jgi:hypothetical protein
MTLLVSRLYRRDVIWRIVGWEEFEKRQLCPNRGVILAPTWRNWRKSLKTSVRIALVLGRNSMQTPQNTSTDRWLKKNLLLESYRNSPQEETWLSFSSAIWWADTHQLGICRLCARCWWADTHQLGICRLCDRCCLGPPACSGPASPGCAAFLTVAELWTARDIASS